MKRTYGWTMAGACFLTFGTSPGCVEREEGITVGRDGDVTITLQYKASEEELSQGDAMPSAGSGWDVVRSREEDKEVLESTRHFAPGESLPQTFAAAGDPDADLYLSFPTTIRIENRADGTYYYFQRVYEPRRWAYVKRWERLIFDDKVKKLSEKPVEELTIEEQTTIAEAFADLEAVKQLEFARAALAESQPGLPIEYGLMARRALLDVYIREGEWKVIQEVIRSCGDLADTERGTCFDEAANRLLDEAYGAYVGSLQRDAGLTPSDIAAFEEAYRRAARYDNITEQLGGHLFGIKVTMPGTIIAHNGVDDDVDIDTDAHTSTVEFEFDGEWFRDHPYELIVVSRLDPETAREMRDHADDSDQ